MERATWWIVRELAPHVTHLAAFPTRDAAKFWEREFCAAMTTDTIPVEVLLEPLREVRI